MQSANRGIDSNGFDYPSGPHLRKHGPQGYATYETYKPWLRDEFVFRCVYCLTRERWYPNGQACFGVDHFVPRISAPDRICDYDNLMYCCVRCNSFKQDNMPLDPCRIVMSEHIGIRDDGTIEAKTPQAHEHIQILGLDDPILTEFRRRMIQALKRLQALADKESRTDLRN